MDTKEILIISAGELFAFLGFDGVSTRMIAEKAEVKLSSIHYHFGSKENLYIQACLYAHQKGWKKNFGDICEERPDLLTSEQGKAEIIIRTILHGIHHHFLADRPEWERKILLREILQPTAAIETLAEKIFRPDVESAENFYLQINPQADRDEASAWADLMYGQLILYNIAEQTIEYIRGQGSFELRFLTTASHMLAKAMILAAGLPMISNLKEYSFENTITKNGKDDEIDK